MCQNTLESCGINHVMWKVETKGWLKGKKNSFFNELKIKNKQIKLEENIKK